MDARPGPRGAASASGLSLSRLFRARGSRGSERGITRNRRRPRARQGGLWLAGFGRESAVGPDSATRHWIPPQLPAGVACVGSRPRPRRLWPRTPSSRALSYPRCRPMLGPRRHSPWIRPPMPRRGGQRLSRRCGSRARTAPAPPLSRRRFARARSAPQPRVRPAQARRTPALGRPRPPRGSQPACARSVF